MMWPWSAGDGPASTLRGALSGAPAATPEDPAEGLARFFERTAAAHPGRDLVLLADAAELPSGWLERLQRAARADDSLAGATALAAGGEPPQFTAFPLAGPAGETAAHGAAPRVLVPGPHCALIRRAAFELLGGLDPAFAHPVAALADFAARARERGLSFALAGDTVIARLPDGLEPPPPAELERLHTRHPWLAPALEDEQALEVGPLRRSLLSVRTARGGISVTIDARALGAGVGGTQTFVGALVLALAADARARVRAVVAHGIDPLAVAEFERAGVEVIDYELAAAGGLPRTDIVHRPQQVFSPSDLRLLELLGERLVVSHMDLIAYRTPSYHASIDGWRAYRRSTRLALAAADRVIFFSEHALRDALAGELIPADRACVAGIGVVPAAADTRGERPARVPAGRELLLVLGADYAHKNRVFALELAGELRRRHGWDGVLVLAGAHVPHGSSAPAERELLDVRPELAAEVVDLGPVPEAEKQWLVRSAAAHLCPSTYEGFGLAPLEAAAAGRPCIYAPCTSLGEIIDPAAATIVPWDAAASADAAAELLRPGAARMRHLDLLRAALERYRWERVIPMILAIYEQALRSPYRPSATRAFEDLQREQLAADMHRAYQELRARTARGLALVDGPDALLTGAQQRGLMRLASRPWLAGPLLAPFGLLGADHRDPRRQS